MRFQPDNWFEALLRPVAMAAPDANVYVEIMAPDLRFVFVLALLVLLAAMSLAPRRRGPEAADGARRRVGARTVFTLAAALAIGFVPWLATTANGRYFLAALLIVGPVCVGLAWLLPLTRAMRLTLAVGMLALQAFVVQQSSPWRAWTMVAWREPPYFHVDIAPELRARPATYVTLSAISYSLLAPMFHPQSRWISLHNAPFPDSASADGRRTAEFLSKATPGSLTLLAPVVAGMLTPQRLPNAGVSEAIDRQLAPYRLALIPGACRFLASRGLADLELGDPTTRERSPSGFWLCQLARRQAGAGPGALPANRHDAVFKALEAQCPRLFPPGGDRDSMALPNGEVRTYLRAEMKAYVYDSGEVYYKYYRALNPVLVGKAGDLLAGRSRLDCGRIRGRSGLPWEREI